MNYFFKILFIFILSLTSILDASRLWGVIQRNNSSLVSDYDKIYKQLLELQLQGSLGNFSDWPYNNDDGWGIIKYSDLTLNLEQDIFNSPTAAINDQEFINSIHEILNYNTNTKISIAHVRKSTSGSYSIPNPHPFNFSFNNRTYSFAHNGTINKVDLLNLLTQNGLDSTWIRQNPPNSYNCGHWENLGFDCIVDSELFFLWIMKNIIDFGDDLRGILNAINILENSDFEVNEFYGEQKNFIFSNGLEIFAYKSSDNISGENRHNLYYKSYQNHFSVMSSPFSIDTGYIAIENQQLIILSSDYNSPIKINTNITSDSLLDIQILNDIISINALSENNCINCNNNGILEESELGNQIWQNNRLVSLDLSNYSQYEIRVLPSSIQLLSELYSFTGPYSKIIPNVYCENLPSSIRSHVQCDINGCTDPVACNYNNYASIDNNTCIYKNLNKDCDNNCIFDLDEDGNCDEISNVGCTDSLGINYSINATINSNCFYDNILLLKKGNNLISLPGYIEYNTEELLNQLDNQNLYVNFILGQGVGIFKLENQWSGNLHYLELDKGYWINAETNFSWHVPIINPPLTGQECIQYQLEDGNNLISYTGIHNNSTINSLNDSSFSNNFNFILGQSVGLFNTEQAWTGNLSNLSHKKGYWLNSLYPMEFYWGVECGESIILDSLNRYVHKNKFHINQSINQSFYLINEIKLNEFNTSEEDYILAYNDKELIGVANYSENLIILPIMGNDLSETTSNYIEHGEVPKIKYYFSNTGKTIDLEGFIPVFENLTVHQLNKLESNLNYKQNEFIIKQIYPNPFNSSATLKFSIPNESIVLIELFDVKGRKIKSLNNKRLSKGNHIFNIKTEFVPSGIYFIKTEILNKKTKNLNVNTQKILLIK